ncbi:MAG: ATP-binding protein [Proteobacteria bacterium]|nr:ATP-binding protein [Pseudomonadota bacterium]
MITVCFHGAESTGKSVLAEELSLSPGICCVPEYGRTYCEENGTDLSMADLLAIAEGERLAIEAARAVRPELLILDTDQLMTAAWAQMLFGTIPPQLLAYPKADHYLLFDADVPWIDDGTRFFGTADRRRHFAGLARDVLVDAGVPFTTISGSWDNRAAQVRAAIAGLVAVRTG